MTRLLASFNQREIISFINEKKAESKTFCQEIRMIISVISILKKLEDYGIKRSAEAMRNPEQVDLEANKRALKARRLR